MDISPESLLEMAKNVVDKNDFVNAIVWLKRGIAKLKGRKGEADELNLIKLHIALIGMLEKVRKVYFFFANDSWSFQISFFSQKDTTRHLACATMSLFTTTSKENIY